LNEGNLSYPTYKAEKSIFRIITFWGLNEGNWPCLPYPLISQLPRFPFSRRCRWGWNK
jgi:hypothetical protein